jgi:hypothetical protein
MPNIVFVALARDAAIGAGTAEGATPGGVRGVVMTGDGVAAGAAAVGGGATSGGAGVPTPCACMIASAAARAAAISDCGMPKIVFVALDWREAGAGSGATMGMAAALGRRGATAGSEIGGTFRR